MGLLGLVALLAASGACSSSSAPTPLASGSTVAPAGSVPDPLVAALDAAEYDGHGPGSFPDPTFLSLVLPDNCEAQPLANVDRPDRLRIVQPCMSMEGTVHDVEVRPDGGERFDLDVPAEQRVWANARNAEARGNRIVVEIVPADRPGCTEGRPPRPPVGDRTFGTCTGANLDVTEGDFVGVVGALVLDTGHGWVSIYPAWTVTHEEPLPPLPSVPGGDRPASEYPHQTVAGPRVTIGDPCPQYGLQATAVDGTDVMCYPPDVPDGANLRWRRADQVPSAGRPVAAVTATPLTSAPVTPAP